MASSTAAGGISWGGMLSYWTMMSVVIQSSRFEQAMNVELAQMALLTEQSVSLQQASLESQNLALEQEQAAESEQAEVYELQNEASVLLEKSHTDMELATTTEQEAIDELTVQKTTEEELSTQHAATAALGEETYEHELEQATADAAEATRLGTLAHGDEASVALCEWIPFLDVVCDWVGGITAVGMESDAASIGARSSSELLSASAAKIDEQVEIELATEFQTKSIEDMTALGDLQTEQDELIAMAKEERAEAEALELQADKLQQQVETEEEQAAQNEKRTEEEQTEADLLGKQAIRHGVKACWNSMLANGLSVIAAAYFVTRTIFRFLIPNVAKAYTNFIDGNPYNDIMKPRKSTVPTFPLQLLRDISYIVQHCVIFLLTLVAWRTSLLGLTQYDDLRVRGGIIVAFALTGGIIQALLLHTIPGSLVAYTAATSAMATQRMVCSVSKEFVQRSFLLSVLFALEILILWVNLGTKETSDGIFPDTPKIFPGALWLDHLLKNQYGCILAGIFALIILLHLWFVELPYRRCHWCNRQSSLRHSLEVSALPKDSAKVATATVTFWDVESTEEYRPLLVSNVTKREQLGGRDEPSKLAMMETAAVIDHIIDIVDEEQQSYTGDSQCDGVYAAHCQGPTKKYSTSAQSIESTPGSSYQTIDLGSSSHSKTIASSAKFAIYGTQTSSSQPSNASNVTSRHSLEYPNPTEDYSFLCQFYNFQLPFELLVVSCVVAIISHCIPTLLKLWPTSRALLLSSRPQWLSVKCLYISGGIVLGMVLLLVAHHCKRKFQPQRHR